MKTLKNKNSPTLTPVPSAGLITCRSLKTPAKHNILTERTENTYVSILCQTRNYLKANSLSMLVSATEK